MAQQAGSRHRRVDLLVEEGTDPRPRPPGDDQRPGADEDVEGEGAEVVVDTVLVERPDRAPGQVEEDRDDDRPGDRGDDVHREVLDPLQPRRVQERPARHRIGDEEDQEDLEDVVLRREFRIQRLRQRGRVDAARPPLGYRFAPGLGDFERFVEAHLPDRVADQEHAEAGDEGGRELPDPGVEEVFSLDQAGIDQTDRDDEQEQRDRRDRVEDVGLEDVGRHLFLEKVRCAENERNVDIHGYSFE